MYVYLCLGRYIHLFWRSRLMIISEITFICIQNTQQTAIFDAVSWATRILYENFSFSNETLFYFDAYLYFWI